MGFALFSKYHKVQHSKLAFTAPEFLVGAAIMLIITAISIKILVGTTRFYQTNLVTTEIKNKAHFCMDRMSEELKNMYPHGVIFNDGYIRFYIPQQYGGGQYWEGWSGWPESCGGCDIEAGAWNLGYNFTDAVMYIYVAGQQQIMRIQGSDSRVLCKNVVDFTTFIDADGVVQLSITTEKPVPFIGQDATYMLENLVETRSFDRTLPLDFGQGAYCPNGWCDVGIGEDIDTCPDDCTPMPCGDGVCNLLYGENPVTCCADCGVCE